MPGPWDPDPTVAPPKVLFNREGPQPLQEASTPWRRPETRHTCREMHDHDQRRVLDIYRQGIATGHATFQNQVPEWRDWDAGHLTIGRVVCTRATEVIGWAALSPVSSRPVYRGVAEVSLYVASKNQGQGIGKRLLNELIATSETAGIWTLQAGIFPENKASIRLHQRCGFRTVGRRERLARMSHGPMAGQWRDVILLERRSSLAGSE